MTFTLDYKTFVEQVAEAMWRGTHDSPWDSQPETVREPWRIQARAALKAEAAVMHDD